MNREQRRHIKQRLEDIRWKEWLSVKRPKPSAAVQKALKIANTWNSQYRVLELRDRKRSRERFKAIEDQLYLGSPEEALSMLKELEGKK